jgi:hypothetical protein
MNSGKDGQKDQKGKVIHNFQKFRDLWKEIVILPRKKVPSGHGFGIGYKL